ncbi:glycosyltransferase, partial [Pseudomonas sp. FSL R10-0071]
MTKPDVVHVHSSKAGVIGRLAAKSLSIPVVFTAHG